MFIFFTWETLPETFLITWMKPKSLKLILLIVVRDLHTCKWWIACEVMRRTCENYLITSTNIIARWIISHAFKMYKAKFRRRTSHEPNRMQMRENKGFCSFAFDSAHVKYGVWTWPNLLKNIWNKQDFFLKLCTNIWITLICL